MLALQMKGIKLTSVEGFMRKSDPFFELSCKRDAPGSLTWYVTTRQSHPSQNIPSVLGLKIRHPSCNSPQG